MRLAILAVLPFWSSAALSKSLDDGNRQQPIAGSSSVDNGAHTTGVSAALFASLERMARLVDVTYCVGTTGIAPPFSCASRCSDFPTLHLVQTWNTGVLMTDSCGYVAVDRGSSPLSSSGLTFSSRTGGRDMPHEPAIIVAFRGTYSITNTVIDLSTVPQEYVPYPEPPGDGDDDGDSHGRDEGARRRCGNCTVHSGFLSSWRSARPLVLPALQAARAAYPGYPVHLIGHSLGGAVAALAALELRLGLGWDDVRVTTFGEPRIGNWALVEYLDAAFGLVDSGGRGHGEAESEPEAEDAGRQSMPTEEKLAYRRVTHANDPVPLLPPGEWGYRPHAGEIFIAKADLQPAPEDLRLCRGDRDPSCIAGGGGESDSAEDSLLESLNRILREYRRMELKLDRDSDVRGGLPTRLKPWQLFFAHRDYFWRLGLCVPGGDPTDWGRGHYNVSDSDGDA